MVRVRTAFNLGKYRRLSDDDILLECAQCKETLQPELDKLVRHFEEECLEEDGVQCNSKPFCRFVGKRKEMKTHLEVCPYQKFECTRCQSTVIRKIAANHDCFATLTTRLEKVEQTICFIKEKARGQMTYYKKFNWIMEKVKQKIQMNERRLWSLQRNYR